MHMHKILAVSSVLIVGLIHSASGTVHAWHIKELYSNPTGNLQFIEIETSSDNQHLFQTDNNSRLFSLTPGNAVHSVYFFPNDLGTSLTAFHSVLIGTSNVASVGGVVPDFIIPDGFLLPGGGTLNFVSDLFGLFNGVTYPALPTGLLSYDVLAVSTGINTPQNFAGDIGQVPEPSSLVLVTLGTVGMVVVGRRRRQRAKASETTSGPK